MAAVTHVSTSLPHPPDAASSAPAAATDPRLRRLRRPDLLALVDYLPADRWRIVGIARADVVAELARRGVVVAEEKVTLSMSPAEEPAG